MQKNGCEKLSKAMLFNLETCTMNIKSAKRRNGNISTHYSYGKNTFFWINLISINIRINQASFWSVVFLTTILLRTLNSNKVTKMTQNKISYINVMYRWFMINSYILMPRLLTYKCVIFRLRSPGALPLSELGVFFVWLGFFGGLQFLPLGLYTPVWCFIIFSGSFNPQR